MNVNGWIYRTIVIFLGASMMSFAWPLRGQFGHEWGALITGAFAAVAATALIPWKNYRQAFTKAVFFGSVGFVIGGENIPYGALIDEILALPTLKGAFVQLFTIFFIGATWGAVGCAYLGYGMSEKPVSLKDYAVLLAAGVILLVLAAVSGGSNLAFMIAFTLLILILYFYNALFIKAQIVPLMLFYGLIGFGFGFLIAVLILYYGDKGMLPGPDGWWKLRDQIWGGLGGLSLMLAAYKALGKGVQPDVQIRPTLERWGFVFFVPFICGWNTYNVYTKWFQSTPPAPDLTLAAILLIAGCLLLAAALVYYLKLPDAKLASPAMNPVILGSSVFFSVYLMFFAIAKTIVYSGWSWWEPGFTLFLFETTLILMTLPFILLGEQEGN